MDEFIQLAVQQLGIKESGAKKATGGVLSLLKQHAPAADFQQLIAKLPGADALMNEAQGGGGGGGGVAAGVGGMLGSLNEMLGGKGGSALSVAALLEQSGLSADKLGGLVTMLAGFIEGKAGRGLLDKVLGSVPEIRKLIG